MAIVPTKTPGRTIMGLVRARWLQIFVIGLIFFIIMDLTLRLTKNVNYFPTVILLGAFLVPVTFVTYFYQKTSWFDRYERAGSILPTVLTCAVLSGLIGTIAAGLLEFRTISSNSPLSVLWVGPIEEFTKMIVPVAIFIVMRNRFRAEMDGLLLGVAAGMAFASLETMGNGLVILVSSQGSLGALNEVLLIRGLLSPVGHAAWTGIIAATLWRERENAGRLTYLLVPAFFLVAAALHSLWDYVASFNSLGVIIPSYIAVAGVSLGLLIWRFSEAKKRATVISETGITGG